MKKKILAAFMACALTLGMSVTAFAANQDASFTKTYKITNEGTQNPAETFTFKFTADSISNSNANLTIDDMPEIADSTVTFTAGTATAAGLEKDVAVALADVEWPGVGVYMYDVAEVAGNTAGVVYDDTVAKLKVTVAYDEENNTYYTAFVTLSLEDKDHNGITDVKTAGFTNEYQAGNLTVTKNVTGNLGDVTKYFKVTVTLTGETGKVYADSYTVTGGSYEKNPTTIKVGVPTDFWLKNDETVEIANLPYGVTYTVVEADYTTEAEGEYDAPNYTFDDANKKIDSALDTVVIVNNKNLGIDTGINMDSIPYILLLCVAALGLGMFTMKNRFSKNN